MTAAGAVTVFSATLALGGAALAVSLRNIFHNILGFALAMVGVAGVFVSLGSDFLAVVFVLVYVGAVAIAMVYAVMLSLPLDMPPVRRSPLKIAAALGLAGAAALTLWVVGRSAPWQEVLPATDVSAERIGWRLLSDYVLAFELVSVLLVVAMMGAVMVARRLSAEGEER